MNRLSHGWLFLILAVLDPAGNVVAQESGPRALAAAELASAHTALKAYVSKPDSAFKWEIRERLKVGSCEVLRLHLTSQTWHETTWKHVLYLIKPPNLNVSRNDALLVVGGGSWKPEWPDNGPDQVSLRDEARLMASVADQFGCVVAVLSHVPFQPMMGGKREDEIIAATFKNYLESGDETWPLLLPMVKTAVRAMDATEEASSQEWGLEISEFTVTGASKRGWTTWLTGATDSRVTAIAPMVIDMLNMQVQLEHQLTAWGKYSEQIADYTELDLPKYLSTPEGQRLQAIVDPYAYRSELKQPKLLIFGANDRYWPVDASNQYWDDLEGPKYLLHVPNQGHGIDDYGRVIGSIAALHRSQHGGPVLPTLDWSCEEAGSSVKAKMACVFSLPEENEAPSSRLKLDSMRLWVARSPSRDFRDAKWGQVSLRQDEETLWSIAELEKPASGYVACFGEVVLTTESMPAFLSTQVSVHGPRE